MATESMNDVMIQNGKSPLAVHWPAVFAGFFITMLVYFCLMSLGAAIGASGVPHMLMNTDTIQRMGAGAGLWLLISCIISLAVGSFAAARVSSIVATRVGYYQGGVITALFFTMMVLQIGLGLGVLSYGLGAIKSTFTDSSAVLTNQPQIMAAAEDVLGDLQFRSPPERVLQGVVNRLIYRDQQSAVSYLAAQANISQDVAQTRYNSLKAQITAITDNINRGLTTAIRSMGWLAFALMALGTAAGMAGGGFGAQTNLRKPMDVLDRKALRHQYT